ncbi:MAG: translation initiation factor IF-2 N-terminal domain-containing protein, partial [Desulfobaccales bacterium]
MAKIRIANLAKELKLDVKDLIQRLKDDMGLQEHFTYLSSLDEATVARARQVLSAATTQMEELRVGENVKRRRRVASAPVAAPAPEPEPQVEEAPVAAPREEIKPRKPKEMARIVALPQKEKGGEEALPSSEEVEPAPAAAPAAVAPKGAAGQASTADSGTALK